MKLTKEVKRFSNAFVDIFYPNNCQICRTDLYLNEKHLCLSCSYDLPYIGQSKNELQKLEKLFWGRVKIENVYSLLSYQKGNQTQKLLHELKYKKKTKLGFYFGQILGEIIPNDRCIDVILPIPLHPKRKRQRGYNQSTIIANGISKKTNIRVDEKVIIRTSYNVSQTKFSKYDRWDNVRQIFAVKNGGNIENKHVLLVDDVLTTGATIEACVHELLKIKNCSISIATLAARI